MNFKDPWRVQNVVQQMLLANQPVQENRARINHLFNGNPPWTEEERRENKIFTNVNFLEPMRIAHNAVVQLNNAFRKPGDFFSVKIDTGPVWVRDYVSHTVTRALNRQLKRSRQLRETLSSTFAQIVLHGIGPTHWETSKRAIPKSVGIEDILVPSQTLVSMENLEFFALYREWTYSQLWDMTHGPAVDPGWDMKFVKALLDTVSEMPLQPIYTGRRWLMPEKLEEDIKENSGWFMASSAPKVQAWDFYFRNEDSDKVQWNRRILLDIGSLYPNAGAIVGAGIGATNGDRRSATQRAHDDHVKNGMKRRGFSDDSGIFNTWLYSKDNFEDDYQKIVHWMFGNCSNVAPFRYYSVRSIGYLLYGVSLLQNRIRCKFSDSIFESMLWYFRNVGEDDRERLEKVDLYHMGIIPDGLSFVTQAERHMVNEALIMAGLNQNRQLMAESSASYLPDVAQEGVTREMTATESAIRSQSSVALTSSVINQAYDEIVPMWREVCRRMLDSRNTTAEAEAFRAELDAAQVPEAMRNLDAWEIEPERVMGGGNKAVELTVAKALVDIAPQLDPNAAREAIREYVLALTDDPSKTEMLVPHQPPTNPDTQEKAANAMGTLMAGLPYPVNAGINIPVYLQTLCGMIDAGIQQVAAISQEPDSEQLQATKVAGLFNATNHGEQYLALLARDPHAGPLVKQIGTQLGNQIAQLKGFGQRVQQAEAAKQEQQQQAQGVSPEAQAKIVSAQITAASQARIAEANAAQKQQHKDVAYMGEQRRRDAAAQQDAQRKLLLTQADVAAKDLQSRAEILRKAREGDSEKGDE